MVSEIAFYIEGGGDQRDVKDRLRQGFSSFLSELRDVARRNHVKGWKIVACGGRQAAYDDFCTAVKQCPDVLNVLIVDAEAQISEKCTGVWNHLKQRDCWDQPETVGDNQCFLMVEAMEAWIVADKDNLAKYYGQGFLHRQLPNRRDVEAIPKIELMKALLGATRNCHKGQYHKTRHGFALLETLDARRVRRVAPHCKRLFDVIANEMGADID